MYIKQAEQADREKMNTNTRTRVTFPPLGTADGKGVPPAKATVT